MAVPRAYRPNALDVLEARLALSHAGAASELARNHRAESRHAAPPPHHLVHRVPVHHAAPAAHHVARLKKTVTTTHPSAPIVVPIAPTPDFPVTAAPSPVAPPVANVPAVSGVESAEEQQIVDLVNQQRAANGLAPLQVNNELVQAAQIQATQMANLDDMSHDLPGAPLPELQDRLAYVGYQFGAAGENIADYYYDANSVMTAWMNSPGHRANILDPSYTEIGVGVAIDSAGNAFYAQEFGTPL